MKVTIKIFFLLLAISLAIGGIMVYAKTKVAPPIALKQINQYSNDIAMTRRSLAEAKDASKEDSIYFTIMDRVKVYELENKLNLNEADKCLDECTSCYCPLFMDRCFSKFNESLWLDCDHNIILNRISELKALSHSDKSMVLTRSEVDSLNLISSIISDYRQARKISKSSSFDGVANAQSVIIQAKKFSRNSYLRNCTELKNSLASVKTSIALSHYNYVSSQVDKLSQYRYFSKTYYEDTLIPHVDAVTTEYDNKAQSLYGSKRDVNALWQKARNYYDQAMSYYGVSNDNN